MACRSEEKAMTARRKLLRLLDKQIAKEKSHSDYNGHAEIFKQNLQINYHHVDMSVASSVFKFTEEVNSRCVDQCASVIDSDRYFTRYAYISHLICNAGCAFWSGVDKLLSAKVIATRGLTWAITLPPFKLQRTGIMSKDGLGCTWQSNIFGHYIMVRSSSYSVAHL